MLRHIPTNLNQQSRDATVLLIREVIRSGLTLSEVRLHLPLTCNL